MSYLRFPAAIHVCTVVALCGVPASADEPEVVRLAITPAVEPLPSLKYQLLPEFIDRREGNAALDYARAAPGYKPTPEFESHVADSLKLTPAEFDQFPKEKQLGAPNQNDTLELLKLAARCTTCEWQPPLRDQMPLSIVLPEVEHMRKMARLVAFHARLRLRERKYVEAIDLLQTGYAMARHIGSEPTLVTTLVGTSIAGMMDQVLLDFSQRPGAPSLYWAVSFQPTPLIDFRPGIEAEMYMLETSFPVLRRHDEWTSVEWNAAVVRFLNELPDMASFAGERKGAGFGTMMSNAVVMGITAARSAELREFLVKCGEDEKKVKAMGLPQLLATFTRLKYNEHRDRLFRLMALPYAESLPLLKDANNRIKLAAINREEVLPWGALFLPAITNIIPTYARADRRHDALRIVEALRLYAGAHDGALPKLLTDVTEVPLPKRDVVTGKPFEYALDGDTARLTLPDENYGAGALVYEITVAK